MKSETLYTPSGNGYGTQLERRRRRGPLLLVGLVVLLAIIGLSLSVFKRSVVYYHTPTEAMTLVGEKIRLSGKVKPGTIRFDVAQGVVTFVVSDGRQDVTVKYTGPAPDTLKDDADAVAEGRMGQDGTFAASTVFARCPSKFTEKKAEK